jgi:hypothetical protein
MLSAKAVVQLTSADLREMARALIGNKNSDVNMENAYTSNLKVDQSIKQYQTESMIVFYISLRFILFKTQFLIQAVALECVKIQQPVAKRFI